MPDADEPIDEAFGVTPEDGEGDTAPAEASARIFGTIEDISRNEITVDNQSDVSSQGELILTIDPENTVLVDAQTALPPQCTPDVVFVNLPEDGETPYYAVIAEEPVVGDNSYRTVTATDGETYVIPDNALVKPFRTRNIVRVEDIHTGTRCLIWLDEQGEASRVVILETE